MKTKDELTKLAFRIGGLVDDMKSREAAELLDDLHTEGMNDASDLNSWSAIQAAIRRKDGELGSAKAKSSFQTPATVP